MDYSFWTRSNEESWLTNLAINKAKSDPKVLLIRELWSGVNAKAADNVTPLQQAQWGLDDLKTRGIDVSPEFAEKIMNLIKNRMLGKKVFRALEILNNTPQYALKTHQEELNALGKDSREILSSLAQNQTFSDQDLRDMIHEAIGNALKEISITDFKSIGKKDLSTVTELMQKYRIGKTH